MYPIGGRLTIGRGRCRGEKPATCINPGDQHTRFPLSCSTHHICRAQLCFCAAEHWWRWVRSPRLIMQGAGSGEVSCPSTLPPHHLRKHISTLHIARRSTICTLHYLHISTLHIARRSTICTPLHIETSKGAQYIAYHPSLKAQIAH